jgi:hypothetical protein
MAQTVHIGASGPGRDVAPGGERERRLRRNVLVLLGRAFRLLTACLAFFCALAATAPAEVSKEYQLKAVFLWRLAQFTQWPAEAFETPESPIVICVLGENPFESALSAAVAGETAHGRKLVVQHHRVVDSVRGCHILYISLGAARPAREIAAALAGRSVLTVRDGGPAGSYETIVRFVTEQNKIRLRVHLKPAKAARLVLDPRLLRSAEVVEGD